MSYVDEIIEHISELPTSAQDDLLWLLNWVLLTSIAEMVGVDTSTLAHDILIKSHNKKVIHDFLKRIADTERIEND